MITDEQYYKAQEQIKEYEQQISKTHILDYTCICCKKAIIKLDSDFQLPSPLEQENAIWKNGTVSKISFGYGSKNDTESFYIAICDDCILAAKKHGYAINIGELEKKLTGKH